MNIKRLAVQALRRLPHWVSAERGTLGDDGNVRLAWFPLRPGTLSGSIGRRMVHDDGNGYILTQWPQLVMRVGTVDYVTGEIRLFFTSREPYILGYCYNIDRLPMQVYEMTIVSTPIVARVRKLKTR